MTDPIADQTSAADGKPSIIYRYAGERALLLEYGPMDLDLTLNFFVLAVDRALRERDIDGVIETAPGFRSILVSYDPAEIAATDLLEELRTVHRELPAEH